MSEPEIQYFKQSPPDHADVFELKQRIERLTDENIRLRAQVDERTATIERLIERLDSIREQL